MHMYTVLSKKLRWMLLFFTYWLVEIFITCNRTDVLCLNKLASMEKTS